LVQEERERQAHLKVLLSLVLTLSLALLHRLAGVAADFMAQVHEMALLVDQAAVPLVAREVIRAPVQLVRGMLVATTLVVAAAQAPQAEMVILLEPQLAGLVFRLL
jgi:hypothetical protein